MATATLVHEGAAARLARSMLYLSIVTVGCTPPEIGAPATTAAQTTGDEGSEATATTAASASATTGGPMASTSTTSGTGALPTTSSMMGQAAARRMLCPGGGAPGRGCLGRVPNDPGVDLSDTYGYTNFHHVEGSYDVVSLLCVGDRGERSAKSRAGDRWSRWSCGPGRCRPDHLFHEAHRSPRSSARRSRGTCGMRMDGCSRTTPWSWS